MNVPGRPEPLGGHRLDPRGYRGNLQRALATPHQDGTLFADSPGGIHGFTPRNTPFLCEINGTFPEHDRIVCGRGRAYAHYPWIDTIRTRSDWTAIHKPLPETVQITGAAAVGVVRYTIDLTEQTATLNWYASTTMAPNSARYIYIVLAKVWWDGTVVTRCVQQHYGMIDLGWLSTMAASYAGPFACEASPEGVNWVVVGWQRDMGALWGASPDYIIIHPDRITLSSRSYVVCEGAGYVVQRLVREGTVSADAPIWSQVIPGNSASELYVPLCQVYWNTTDDLLTSVRQMQYGNIIVDRTTINYCP